MPSNIRKLYASNFLVGLVFWYGIEKLFMQSIGIDAVGIGVATAVVLAFNLVFDIPSGILADRWSRKGVLVAAVIAMALCSLILGSSHSLALYLIGYIFYGMYVVSTSGTYQAIIYDSLYEKGLAEQYSKINGRAYALFLAGAGVANVLSGFLAHSFSYRAVFFLSVVPCILNVLVIASIKEPTFHKAEQKEKMLAQLKSVAKIIGSVKLLFALTVIMSGLAVVELFKGDFGQLYMLRYISAPQLLGLLWAAYAFTWSLGSLIAHKFRSRLNTLVFASVAPLILMSFIDSWFSLVLFMVQAIASAALLNQIETRVQEATPSSVRASVLSVLSSIGRAISIPASFIVGWVVREYNIFWALRGVAIFASLLLIYWWWVSMRLPEANEPVASERAVS